MSVVSSRPFIERHCAILTVPDLNIKTRIEECTWMYEQLRASGENNIHRTGNEGLTAIKAATPKHLQQSLFVEPPIRKISARTLGVGLHER